MEHPANLASISKSLGERIRSLRLQKNWTAAELASQSGVSLEDISKIENGTADPTVGTIVALAQSLGTNGADLLNGIA